MSKTQVGLRLLKSFESSELTITANSVVSSAHGLGAMPKLVAPIIRCVIAEKGYSVGDEVLLTFTSNGAGSNGVACYATTTTVGVAIDEAIGIVNRTTFVLDGALTPANWRIVLRAWA